MTEIDPYSHHAVAEAFIEVAQSIMPPEIYDRLLKLACERAYLRHAPAGRPN
jgi:hypothetical protein